jgi:hypothetical protein
MAQAHCCHGVFVADRCYGKTDVLPTTGPRQGPRYAAEQELGAIVLLAGRQLADVASSRVLVMGALPSQLQNVSRVGALHCALVSSSRDRYVIG